MEHLEDAGVGLNGGAKVRKPEGRTLGRIGGLSRTCRAEVAHGRVRPDLGIDRFDKGRHLEGIGSRGMGVSSWVVAGKVR